VPEVLTTFYGVSATKVPLYGPAFSVGILAGPLLLAPLFDTVDRKKMISGTYLVSGVLLAVSAWLFDNGDLTANSQIFVWVVVIFFFASAGASAAYLTVSETWPIEIRSEAIAMFFTIGTIFGAIGINAEGKSLRTSPNPSPPPTTRPGTSSHRGDAVSADIGLYRTLERTG
jgi:MFS family permease